MANPLQPLVIKTLEHRYKAYVINCHSTKGGDMDIIACIEGRFYGFEIKWKSDTPSELQKQKINKCIKAGGHAWFIYSVKQLTNIIDNGLIPITYDIQNKFTI